MEFNVYLWVERQAIFEIGGRKTSILCAMIIVDHRIIQFRRVGGHFLINKMDDIYGWKGWETVTLFALKGECKICMVDHRIIQLMGVGGHFLIDKLNDVWVRRLRNPGHGSASLNVRDKKG